jgi:hypothetical protein
MGKYIKVTKILGLSRATKVRKVIRGHNTLLATQKVNTTANER